MPANYRACGQLHLNISSQRGLVLVLTLIILAIMSMAAVGLGRSVDTANLSIGNIAFRQGAVHIADKAVKAAIANFVVASSGWLATPANTEGGTTPAASYPSYGYYSSLQTETSMGIPTPLASGSCTAASNPYCVVMAQDADTQETARYIIERLCAATGVATQAGCDTWGVNAAGGSQPGEKALIQTTPLFRVTVRVDGPRNTVTYVQAVFRP